MPEAILLKDVEALRRWRPGGAMPALLACSCQRGRCHICN